MTLGIRYILKEVVRPSGNGCKTDLHKTLAAFLMDPLKNVIPEIKYF